MGCTTSAQPTRPQLVANITSFDFPFPGFFSNDVNNNDDIIIDIDYESVINSTNGNIE